MQHSEPLLAAQDAQDCSLESLALYAIFADRRKQYAHWRRPSKLEQAFFDRVAFGTGSCWYWIGSRSDIGYGMFASARSVYGCPEIVAHRISWHLFRAPIPLDLNVLHCCDIRACVNPDHLFLGTQAENVADMMAKGRNRSVPLHGAANPMARLDEATVLAIRAEYEAGGVSQAQLAEKYGVATMTVNRVVRRQSWSKV